MKDLSLVFLLSLDRQRGFDLVDLFSEFFFVFFLLIDLVFG